MKLDSFSVFFNFLIEFEGEHGGRPSTPTPVSSLTSQNRLLPQIWVKFEGLIWENYLLLYYTKNMGGTLKYGIGKNKIIEKSNDLFGRYMGKTKTVPANSSLRYKRQRCAAVEPHPGCADQSCPQSSTFWTVFGFWTKFGGKEESKTW